MQINIKGEMTLAQLRQALYEQLGEVERQFAIGHSRGATLYVNPTNGEGGTVLARSRDGKAVSRIDCTGPYRSAAEQFNI